MKTHCNVYTISIVFLLFIQLLISGCAAPVSKDLSKKDLSKEEESLIRRDLFKDKCSLCHELPDVNAYPYTTEDWSSIVDVMHDTKAARRFISAEEAEEIKSYLKKLLDFSNTK